METVKLHGADFAMFERLMQSIDDLSEELERHNDLMEQLVEADDRTVYDDG